MLGTIVIAGCLAVVLSEDVTVMLDKGKLKGERMDYDFGQYYYAFKGVPYAKPPVKELRFKVGKTVLYLTIVILIFGRPI
jgi:hypothetical protein